MSQRSGAPYPDHPVLARVWRGEHVESQHRGVWAVVDSSGTVLDGAGDARFPIYARSAIKCLQALPLVESGAAARFELSSSELALALASHNAEPEHVAGVRAVLARVGLGAEHLRCGPQQPRDPEARAALALAGESPSALHNNCSGKHAGFLTLTRHLGADPDRYLEPGGAVQTLVRAAVAQTTGLPEDELTSGVDGCSAPTYRLPLAALGTAFARVTTPDGLAPERRAACERLVAAVARHPVLVAGRHRRLCTALARASAGALFPKIGGEAVYAVGAVGHDRALVVKIDDGANRALHAVVLHLLARLGWLDERAREALADWIDAPLTNWAGLRVGRIEVTA